MILGSFTTLPKGHKAIGVKWVYKTKRNAKGEIKRHKAKLVAKGYSQKTGIDYDEVFALVARLETIILIISLAAQNKWKIFQMDVKFAFLNRFLEEEVYIEQPLGYVVKGYEDKVLRLKKALYGLKQAPRAWNNIIDKYFQEKGFNKCPYEHALYVKEKDKDIFIVCLYVDDLIFTGFKQKEEGIFISQESYAKEILKKFKMNYCKPISTLVECGVKLSKHDKGKDIDSTFFKSLVGSLGYLTCSRLDILYAVGLVSRYMENPKTTHFKAAKRILRYIKGTTNFSLLYSFSNDYKLVGYSDSDWGGDVDDRKSTTGFVFFMGDTAFTWMSKKQPIVTLSTCEAEYVAATSSVCHAIWLRNLLKELGLPQEEPTDHPERFLSQSNSEIDVRGLHYQLLPFGTGRRGCPGLSLAMQELPTTLAAMIQCFNFKVTSPDGVVDMSERPQLSSPRARDLMCVPVARCPRNILN
ncbi:hypothetical protein KPL71_008669 [Citrus sinensis]|uniref:Uncharacterized protein n=1 Tax=Citrus sinensis TaxID=2711 RepID=A0ACB8M895_CITSI|nr:hypothetical protein KPL71_008669 [Citrus sinensis]